MASDEDYFQHPKCEATGDEVGPCRDVERGQNEADEGEHEQDQVEHWSLHSGITSFDAIGAGGEFQSATSEFPAQCSVDSRDEARFH